MQPKVHKNRTRINLGKEYVEVAEEFRYLDNKIQTDEKRLKIPKQRTTQRKQPFNQKLLVQKAGSNFPRHNMSHIMCVVLLYTSANLLWQKQQKRNNWIVRKCDITYILKAKWTEFIIYY